MDTYNDKSTQVQRNVIDRDKTVLQCIIPVLETSSFDILNLASFINRRAISLLRKWGG